jgi:hypothetical protein
VIPNTASGRMYLPANKNASGAIPLAQEIKRAGMMYREFWRSGNVAVYCAKGRGPRIEYEVFRVQILPAEEINGNSYPVREAFPKTSSWGESGWTFTNNSHRDPLAAALAKAEHIASRNRVEEAEQRELNGRPAVTIGVNAKEAR